MSRLCYWCLDFKINLAQLFQTLSVMCHTHNPVSYLEGQGHSLRSKLIVCPVCNFVTVVWIWKINWLLRWCVDQNFGVKVQLYWQLLFLICMCIFRLEEWTELAVSLRSGMQRKNQCLVMYMLFLDQVRILLHFLNGSKVFNPL